MLLELQHLYLIALLPTNHIWHTGDSEEMFDFKS